MSPAQKSPITLKTLLTLVLTLFISLTPFKSHAAISALWHLDRWAGQTIADSSGNGNNGTLKYINNPACSDADGPNRTKGKQSPPLLLW